MEALLLIGGFVFCGVLGYAAAGLAERFRREINGENPRVLPVRKGSGRKPRRLSRKLPKKAESRKKPPVPVVTK